MVVFYNGYKVFERTMADGSIEYAVVLGSKLLATTPMWDVAYAMATEG